jgi:hypothetical protein
MSRLAMTCVILGTLTVVPVTAEANLVVSKGSRASRFAALRTRPPVYRSVQRSHVSRQSKHESEFLNRFRNPARLRHLLNLPSRTVPAPAGQVRGQWDTNASRHFVEHGRIRAQQEKAIRDLAGDSVQFPFDRLDSNARPTERIVFQTDIERRLSEL